MRGIFAASTGFSVQFFPESVILGCEPDAARACAYTVVADGTKSFIKIDASDHPLTLGFRPDGLLDAALAPIRSTDASSPVQMSTTTSHSLHWSRPATLPSWLPANRSLQSEAALRRRLHQDRPT